MALAHVFGRSAGLIAASAAALILSFGTPSHAAAKRVLLRDIGAPTLAQATQRMALQGLSEARNIAQRDGKVAVIVGLKVPFAAEAELPAAEAEAQRNEIAAARSALRDRMARLGRASGPEPRGFESVPFVAMQVTPAELEVLTRQDTVLSISVDRWNRLNLAQSTAVVSAPAAWSAGFTGAGKVVAVIDSGVDKAHPFLAGKVVSEACYSGGGLASRSLCPGQVLASTAAGSGRPCSLSGCLHGTHVAGIAAGAGASFSGVAKGARLIAIQVASNNAGAIGIADSDILAALQRVYALRGTYSIAAVNMSLGGGGSTTACDTSPLKPIIDNLRAANIATVIASGNDGFTNALSYPACISSAVSVGATWDVAGQAIDCDPTPSTVDRVACFSNTSSLLHLLAPGIWINSSVPGGGYAVEAGTSMAAPHVAGAWAVMRQKFPTAPVSLVLAALRNSGTKVTHYETGQVTPRINVAAALNAIKSISLGAASYTVTEGTASLVVPVRRSSSLGTASVAYKTANATALAGSDYTAVAGTLNFAAGALTANITIPILDNLVPETNETFKLTLSTPSAGYTLLAPLAATVTIRDNDPGFRFGAASYAVTEGTASIVIPVTRSRTTDQASVKYSTVNGSAASGSDFTGKTLATLNFPIGVGTANVVIPIVNDAVHEVDETFSVKLSAPSAGYGLLAPATSTVTIHDND